MDFEEVEHKLEKPLNSNKAVILLPGVSGNALTDERYNKLGATLVNANFALLRFDVWKSEVELERLTISEIYDILNQAFSFLQSKGYTEISMVGKSFGAGLLLPYVNINIKRLVLWAPAIKYSTDSNFIFAKETKLQNFQHLSDIKINKRDLYHINYPILILHGTKDEFVTFSNSQRIVYDNPKIKLKAIEDADHSYSNDNWLNLVIQETINFLKNN